MSGYLQQIMDGYHDLMVNKRDPRVDGWLFMSSPFPTLLMCAAYIYGVTKLGPRWMRDRQAFELRKTIIVYNFLQVAFSVYLVYLAIRHGWSRYNLRCQPVDYSDNPDEMIMVCVSYYYYLCKFTEFLDTVFFILRKKFDQVTALHVIHHGLMPTAVWWGVKFTPGGHATFFGLLNTIVHVVMYTYYMLAAMGPRYQKYLWWKKHLTTMQMVQFVMVFVHSGQVFFNGCNFPKTIVALQCFSAFLFLCLFSNFYIQAYIKRRRLPPGKKPDEANGKPVKNGKAESGNASVGKMINKMLANATSACYIGQNGLYENGTSNGKKKDL